MGDIGAGLATEGFEARSASDKQILALSALRSLKIHSEGSWSGLAGGATITTHSLGYIPIFLCLGLKDSQGITLPSFDQTNGAYVKSPRMSTTNLIVPTGLPAVERPDTGYFYIFRQRLDLNYGPVSVLPTDISAQVISGNIGFALAKSTKDARSTGIKNMGLVSSGKSGSFSVRTHVLHMVETGAWGGTIIVTHNLGYIPMVVWYAKLDGFGDGRWQIVNNAFDTQIRISTTTTTMLGTADTGNYACVVFKDPGK